MNVLHVAGAIWSAGLLTIAAYGIFQFIRGYHRADGSVWHRMLMGARDSATILWARAVFIAAAGLNGVVYIANFLGSPEVSSAIQQYLPPQVVAAIMIGIVVITEFARRRRQIQSA